MGHGGEQGKGEEKGEGREEELSNHRNRNRLLLTCLVHHQCWNVHGRESAERGK